MAWWHGRWRQGQTEHNGVVLHKQKALDYAEENKAKLAQARPSCEYAASIGFEARLHGPSSALVQKLLPQLHLPQDGAL
jgi:hypothetical protein